MKHYTLLSTCLALIVLLVFAGCVNTTPKPIQNPDNQTPGVIPIPSSGWMAYAPVQADTNPWQAYQPGLNAGKSELEKVEAWLEGNGINTTAYGFIPHDEVVCQSLNCPRGDYLIIQPTDTKASTFFHEMGFFPYDEVGVFTTPPIGESHAQTITIVNAMSETIYYGGCNEFTPILVTPEGEIPGPVKTCIWEGIPTPLEGGSHQTYSFSPAKNGTYYIHFGYGIGCMPQKPASEAQCTSGGNTSSLPFEVNVWGASKFVKMQYEITQCRSNPWQAPESTATPEEDLDDFKEWLSDQKINPQSIAYIPPAEGQIVCLACSCGQGDYYQIVIATNQQKKAEDAGFTYVGVNVPVGEASPYVDAQWYITTPFQCFANKWNVEKKTIYTPAMDMEVMKVWLESQGVNVTYLALIPGFSLTKECLKKATDAYGVGVTDDESAVKLQELGFLTPGKSQLAAFTDTSNTNPLTLIYKSKFCTPPAWGSPEMSNGNEAETVSAAADWLAMQGMEIYEGPTIHGVTPSYSAKCDTDSGWAVKVSIPAWAKPHLLAQGFTVPSYSFDEQNEQIYPVPGLEDLPV